jgi:hypothetical protein
VDFVSYEQERREGAAFFEHALADVLLDFEGVDGWKIGIGGFYGIDER